MIKVECASCKYTYDDPYFISGLLFFGPNKDGSLDFICIVCEERVYVSPKELEKLVAQLEVM